MKSAWFGPALVIALASGSAAQARDATLWTLAFDFGIARGDPRDDDVQLEYGFELRARLGGLLLGIAQSSGAGAVADSERSAWSLLGGWAVILGGGLHLNVAAELGWQDVTVGAPGIGAGVLTQYDGAFAGVRSGVELRFFTADEPHGRDTVVVHGVVGLEPFLRTRLDDPEADYGFLMSFGLALAVL